jgi:hypothetical protein
MPAVSDICQGWGISITHHTESEWSSKAERFAQAMCQGDTSRLEDISNMAWAFLNGVKWGNAREPNPKFRGDRTRRTLFRAKKIGMPSATQLIIKKLDAIKSGFLSLEEQERRALPLITPSPIRGRRPMLLIQDDEEDDSGYEDLDAEMSVCDDCEEVDDDVEMADDEDPAYDDDSDGSVYEL